jgi:hypothetical protein
MEKNKIISHIDSQISELGRLQTLFGAKTNRFDGFVALDKIDSKISSIRKMHIFYLVLSIILGGLLYVAGFAQVFDFGFIDLSKSGLLIILAIGNILMTFRHKIDMERLKMIKNLLELEQMVDKKKRATTLAK